MCVVQESYLIGFYHDNHAAVVFSVHLILSRDNVEALVTSM